MAAVRRRRLRTIRGTAPDRGTCQGCGKDKQLVFTTGMVPRHDGCPGGGRPPAESSAEQTIQTDERL